MAAYIQRTTSRSMTCHIRLKTEQVVRYKYDPIHPKVSSPKATHHQAA